MISQRLAQQKSSFSAVAGLPAAAASAPEEPSPVELDAKLFRALGDPTRLQIVEALLEREHNVSELMALLGAPQSRVSNQLMCLRWCGFVASRRQGKYIYYRVTDPLVRDLALLARELSTEHAAALAACPRIDGRGVLSGRARRAGSG